MVEQVRLSPAPKLGGWVGQQLRLLSVTRGQSVITDLEQGSLAVNRRTGGLPSMQRMWFQPQGFSLGYTKPRGTPEPAELFFVGPDARLWARQRLPASAIEASAGTDQWFVTCRNGRVYAFSLDGGPLWNQLVPCPRRDNATNELWGLPIFHPRLHLAVEGGLIAVGAEQQLHRYDTYGERLWSRVVPTAETSGPPTIAVDLPTREQRLLRLGVPKTVRTQVRTGYVRLRLDTLLDAGWLKQVEVSDVESWAKDQPASNPAIEMGASLLFNADISAVRVSWNAIVIGTQKGFVHVFDREGALRQTFRVGEVAVSDLLVRGEGPKAAYCAGRLTLFERGQVAGITELPEYSPELTDCGSGVLVWKSNAFWLVDSSGRVQLAAQSDRPIRGIWGCATGFYVLAGGLTSFQLRGLGTSNNRGRSHGGQNGPECQRRETLEGTLGEIQTDESGE